MRRLTPLTGSIHFTQSIGITYPKNVAVAVKRPEILRGDKGPSSSLDGLVVPAQLFEKRAEREVIELRVRKAEIVREGFDLVPVSGRDGHASRPAGAGGRVGVRALIGVAGRGPAFCTASGISTDGLVSLVGIAHRAVQAVVDLGLRRGEPVDRFRLNAPPQALA